MILNKLTDGKAQPQLVLFLNFYRFCTVPTRQTKFPDENAVDAKTRGYGLAEIIKQRR